MVVALEFVTSKSFLTHFLQCCSFPALANCWLNSPSALCNCFLKRRFSSATALEVFGPLAYQEPQLNLHGCRPSGLCLPVFLHLSVAGVAVLTSTPHWLPTSVCHSSVARLTFCFVSNVFWSLLTLGAMNSLESSLISPEKSTQEDQASEKTVARETLAQK